MRTMRPIGIDPSKAYRATPALPRSGSDATGRRCEAPLRFLVGVLVLGVILIGCVEAPGSETESWHASPIEETRPLFTEHFPPEEFAERRDRVYDAIGPDAVAVLQGAPTPMGFVAFRQSNEFYHLTGIESPHAYLVLDGEAREATLYLGQRREGREYGEGKMLSAEDADLVRELAGISQVRSTDQLRSDLQARSGANAVYAPFAPPELRATTRNMANRTFGDIADDPMDDREPRHERFLALLRADFGVSELQDLNPILDEIRMVKSERELQMIRASSRLHGLAMMEAMRATEPGVTEYDIEAVARYVFWRHGAKGSAYYALSHVASNAHMNHYHAGVREALDGDMILLDYGADYHYYVSDMSRMWPANGRFNDVQRELYGFYLAFYEAILHRIRPGVSAQEVKLEALEEIDEILSSWEFSRPSYQEAARDFVEAYREGARNPGTRLGHGVGMAAHDPFPYEGELVPGMVFVIEPQFRVSDELIYLRLEDTIILTEDGAEIVTDFVPRDMESIERLVQQRGILQDYQRLMSEDGEFLDEAERLISAARGN